MQNCWVMLQDQAMLGASAFGCVDQSPPNAMNCKSKRSLWMRASNCQTINHSKKHGSRHAWVFLLFCLHLECLINPLVSKTSERNATCRWADRFKKQTLLDYAEHWIASCPGEDVACQFTWNPPGRETNRSRIYYKYPQVLYISQTHAMYVALWSILKSNIIKWLACTLDM